MLKTLNTSPKGQEVHFYSPFPLLNGYYSKMKKLKRNEFFQMLQAVITCTAWCLLLSMPVSMETFMLGISKLKFLCSFQYLMWHFTLSCFQTSARLQSRQVRKVLLTKGKESFVSGWLATSPISSVFYV